MIKNNEPLSMAESLEYIEKDSEVSKFVKKFTKLSLKESKEFKRKLLNLGLRKLKLDHIIKIIDLMPGDKGDLNKIFISMSLDEDETKKILDIVEEFK